MTKKNEWEGKDKGTRDKLFFKKNVQWKPKGEGRHFKVDPVWKIDA